MFKKTLLTVAVAAMSINQAQAFNGVDVIKVFAGIMDGILHTDNLNYLLGCMNGTDSMVVDVENMVTHFKQGGSMGIGEGIMDIGKFLQDLPPTVYYCGGIPDDFAKLGQFFSIFGNPSLLSQRIAYNLLWYYTDINNAISEAIAHWDASEYYEFGKSTGKALVLALGDHSTANPVRDQVVPLPKPIEAPKFMA